MNAYEEHPDHQAIANKGGEMIETFYAMDYWTGGDSNKDVNLD